MPTLDLDLDLDPIPRPASATGPALSSGQRRCPVHERCGGCPRIELPDAARAELSRAEAAQALHALGLQLPSGAAPSFHASPEPLAYRNRVRLTLGPDAMPRFFNPEKALDCAVLSPSVLAGLGWLRARARAEPELFAAFGHLELRGRDELGRWGLRCTPRDAHAAPRPPALGEGWLTGVSAAGNELPCQRWRVTPECCIEVPLDAFLQINPAVNRALVSEVVARSCASGARSFADLFMGAGNFALPLLGQGLRGLGVERHAGAVAAARRVAGELGASAELVVGDALEVAAGWAAAGRRLDVVVCDPPRAGLGERAAALARLAQRSVALVSCRLDSACADAARLVAQGFAIESVALFDMFPQTRHVEVLIWLERRP